MNSHHLITTGGGYRCNRCGCAWDIGEDMSGECRGDEYLFNTATVEIPLTPAWRDYAESVRRDIATDLDPPFPDMLEPREASFARPVDHWTPALADPMKRQVQGTHYSKLVIQPTEFCMRNGLDFCIGSILKYVTRHRAKNGAEDLRKARHFVEIREAFPFDIRTPPYIAITMLEYVTRNSIRPDDAEALYRLEAYYNATDTNVRAAAQRVITEIDKLVETTY